MSADRPGAGALRDRVALSRKQQVAEADGGQSVLFMPLATVWARVHARASGRTGFADARGARATHTVVMRFRTDLSAGDRVTWRGRALEVLSAEDLNGRRAYLSCACAETTVTG